jgi:hypothetical protein
MAKKGKVRKFQDHESEERPVNRSTKVHLLVKELSEWIAYFSYKPDK